MKINMKGLTLPLALLALCGTVLAADSVYRLDWYVLTGSGGASVGSTNYTLDYTIGQAVVGAFSSANFRLGAGYWYGALGATTARLYLPMLLKLVTTCSEPANNTRAGACGPLVSGQVYRDYISSSADDFDWFYLDIPAEHTIEAWLTSIPPGSDYDLYVTDAQGNLIRDSANGGVADEHVLTQLLPAGRYYLAVARIEGWSADAPYALRVDC